MLKGKQKRYLRSLAVTMSPIFQIGKGGINDNMVKQIVDTLEVRELIKVRVLNNAAEPVDSLATTIAAATGSELVQVIGHNFLLYKESSKKPQIELPR
ncbi:MAG: ribosome assembly RNA-binding protein YhbY [Peptococcaceae bacterium]|jgi:RNA-binding protein|nr:ribosome assembly RNA-binding protein YhbY [Peptococcaceae bacterium]